MSIRNHNTHTNPATQAFAPLTPGTNQTTPEHTSTQTPQTNTPGTTLLAHTTATQYWKQHHPEHQTPTTITHTNGTQALSHTQNNTGTPTIVYGNYTNVTPHHLHALLTTAAPWTHATPFDTPTDTIGYLTNWTNNTPPHTRPPHNWLPTPHTQPLILLQGPFEHWHHTTPPQHQTPNQQTNTLMHAAATLTTNQGHTPTVRTAIAINGTLHTACGLNYFEWQQIGKPQTAAEAAARLNKKHANPNNLTQDPPPCTNTNPNQTTPHPHPHTHCTGGGNATNNCTNHVQTTWQQAPHPMPFPQHYQHTPCGTPNHQPQPTPPPNTHTTQTPTQTPNHTPTTHQTTTRTHGQPHTTNNPTTNPPTNPKTNKTQQKHTKTPNPNNHHNPPPTTLTQTQPPAPPHPLPPPKPATTTRTHHQNPTTAGSAPPLLPGWGLYAPSE